MNLPYLSATRPKAETAHTGHSAAVIRMSDSENVNGAWEFLKYYLFSEKDDMRSGFSGLEKTFTKQLEYEKAEHRTRPSNR